MTDDKFKKEFLKVMDKFSGRYSKWQIWTDFLYLSAAAIANVVPVAEREEREKRYLEIINRYDKEHQELFPQLFGLVVMALEDNPEQDFLGELYHQLHLEQHQKGQFFTPYHVCHLMAEIQLVDRDIENEKKNKDFISVHDPACGAGALLIAFANVAKKHGINYCQDVLFVAQDIDMTAALMCYLQLSLLGCPAVIIVGDSLAKPGFHPDNQVWYSPIFYLYHWKFRDFINGTETKKEVVTINDEVSVESTILKYMENEEGQLILPTLKAS